MVSLEKNNPHAIAFVQDFIQGQWQEDKYVNIGYGNINKHTLRTFCAEEQHWICCYCCRDISHPGDITLEHIIPRACNDDEFQKYIALSPILHDNVVLQDVFANAEEMRTPPPFPHHIAYHNIVAACNGRVSDYTEEFTCCNPERGEVFLPPFNLMGDCITYHPDGTVSYEDTEYVNLLNLNKGLLKKIRQLWYLFATSDIIWQDIQDANTEQDRAVLFAVYILNGENLRAKSNLTNMFRLEDFWKIFLKYSYFFNRFRALP